MNTFWKWLRRGVVVLLVLCALLVVLVLYPVLSFDTEKLPERYGQVDVQAYPSTAPARPMIVGFGGAEGGNSWTSARWKAQRDHFNTLGYNMLAVGYFGMENTPKDLDRISLDAIHAAIDRGRQQQSGAAANSCVILVGGSKGAELALALAANFDDVDAVIGIVPGSAVFAAHTQAMNTSSWMLADKPLPFVPVPWSATWDLINHRILAVMERSMADKAAFDAASIPVERIRGPIYFLSATRDELWPSTRMSELMIARLKQHNSPYASRHVAIEGDHGEPLNHLHQLDGFLAELARSNPDCLPRP